MLYSWLADHLRQELDILELRGRDVHKSYKKKSMLDGSDPPN